MNRIQSPLIIARHASIAAAMFAFVLALAGVANASSMYPAHAHKAKKGHLTIMAPAEVGGTVLQPGNYEVKVVNSPTGAVLEFVHQFRNKLASEVVQADQEEVVARVKFTEQVLNSTPKHTQLMLKSWYSTDAIGLEIRGNAVGYVFAPSQMTVKADPTAVCTNGGLHNEVTRIKC